MSYVKVPHVLPYQGSKRKIAEKILESVDFDIKGSFIEPFAGSAAVSLLAISNKKAKKYIISDKYKPISDLWILIKNNPIFVYEEYKKIWSEQFKDQKSHFTKIRNDFNNDLDPIKFLYLMTRCVKNAIRFNSDGHFNQSSDNRRNGINPEKLKKSIINASNLLSNNIEILNLDFEEVLNYANSDDFIYLDPPWQGTSFKANKRYAYTLNFEKFIKNLGDLNKRNIPFILSFDGRCGEKKYGSDLPSSLSLLKIDINAGRSSQATLLGKDEITVESLYLSPALVARNIKYLVCA